jgi:tRNA-splicing ligase RtcB
MDLARLHKVSGSEWRLEPEGAMRVPAVFYADEGLIADMDDKVLEQIGNVACLPGIIDAAYTMPDAHWGYGFPIGGVAAFDPDEGGVVSAGGVGFDISCGVRTLLTGLKRAEIERVKEALADSLYRRIPAGLGSTGAIPLDEIEMDRMLAGGARWALEQGYGRFEDLERIEERGTMPGARPEAVSSRAKQRQRAEMGTLGSGNHYLEVQEVAAISDAAIAAGLGWRRAISSSASIAARAASATRSARISCARWRSRRPRTGSRCPISSWPAPRSAPNWASATSARCAPASTARSPTARS